MAVRIGGWKGCCQLLCLRLDIKSRLREDLFMPAEVQLSPSQLTEVISVLNRFVPEARVFVYGSRAKSASHNSGNLDLLVSADSAIEWHRLQKLKRAFGDSDLPFFVDVCDEKTMEPNVYALIRSQKLLIKEPKALSA